MTYQPVPVDIEDQESFFYFERTETCDRHFGVKVTFQVSKYDRCPLCAALDEIADYETID